jgi:hypothetical protein
MKEVMNKAVMFRLSVDVCVTGKYITLALTFL